ncbi:MAG TPA: hypothetical protein PK459_01895 [Anaerolineaceae bacterium]|jgi:hypothetical protein|nr:hypothetical protein [Anaerolineaceae bacterium]HQC63833.1 hypothetical protein [Anaerolineaceae bacterium]HQL92395.1 hypothetical protein [Anaerolineaceae bacterium]HQN69338.1 hypothetical protein [Anaerolineaceae bacterium]
MKDALIGKWSQNEGQDYPGLWFDFKEDGSFKAGYEAMGIESGGTWTAEGNKIDMDQTYHTFGFIGKTIGIFEIEGDQLKLEMVSEEVGRPETFGAPLLYTKI